MWLHLAFRCGKVSVSIDPAKHPISLQVKEKVGGQ